MPYFTKHVNSVDHEYVRQQFTSGKAAMIYAETAEIKLVEPVNLGLFPFPKISGEKGSPRALTGSPEGFMISSKTKHPKEAMEFLQFLTSKKMGEKLIKDVGKYSAVQGTATENNSARSSAKPCRISSAPNQWCPGLIWMLTLKSPMCMRQAFSRCSAAQ
ncbi:extracellular solute-binding protein [Bacillus sp. 4A_MP3]